ncbi:hypothetical protein N1027_07095 [Herbiconiux sp. CPCC 205763]|uniref:Uncharacterized protein n=1 Tax=Herbiconiux aconitum TaxID=2970913 RepID=A0ABT2GNV6_9MICO|nr:hypothetical protein [Herbiconiux aconitum]MCS5717899.1 hypothetical protein [Herbiconiux aconitum]
MSDAAVEYCATLVVREAVTKLDALVVVALAVDRPIHGAGTAHPFIELESGARVEVEIPKFGEPPPLAVDVYSHLGFEHAAMSALALLGRLEESTAWMVKPDFTL